MKKILIFSTAYLPFIGGAEIAIKEITARLPDDFSFDLITARLSKKLPLYDEINGVRVFRIGFGIPILDKTLLPFLGAIEALSLLHKNKYSAFWVIMISFAGGAAYVLNIFRFLFGKKAIPIVLTLQEGDSEKHLRYKSFGLIHLSWKVALRWTHDLTAISSYLVNRAHGLGFKGEARLIPNGVDFSRFLHEYSTDELSSLREKHNLPLDSKVLFLITTSRLVLKNGVKDIILSLSFLPDHIHLLIVGEGKEKGMLEKIAKERSLVQRVHFLSEVPHNDIPKYLKLGNIFVRPSLSEGLGNSFLEAMASGLPIIGTPVGGIVDFLFDPEKNPEQKPTGIFCEVENPKSIADAVQKITTNPSLRESLVLNARDLVSKQYDWNKIAQQFKNLFEKITI